MPNTDWVQECKENLLSVYCPLDLLLRPSEILPVDIQCSYDLVDAVGIPFIPRRMAKLADIKHEVYYANKTFKWMNNCPKATITIHNPTFDNISIEKGTLLCYVALMTSQYYELNRRNDNSDKGLRSAVVNIELK